MQSILVTVQWLVNNTMKTAKAITIMALVVYKNLTVRYLAITTSSRIGDLITITTTTITIGVGTKTVNRTFNVSILMITAVETVISTITIIRETSTTTITKEISTTNNKTSTGKTIQEVITRIETSTKEICVVAMVGDTKTVTVITTIKVLLKVIKTSN